jgi:ribonuclease III
MFRNKKDEEKLSILLNYQFQNQTLLLQALTRPSALNEGQQVHAIGNFQRLEFIGDKILNLVISDILMERYSSWSEGKLTQEVAKFVNNQGPLAFVARQLKLGEFLIMVLGRKFITMSEKTTKSYRMQWKP